MAREIPICETKVTPLDICLTHWCRYQCRDDENLGYRYKDSILSSESALDFDQLVDRVDNDIAQAVDAMIDSLSPHHRWAITLKCGFAKVWRFAQLQYDKTLEAAEHELINKLKKNAATATFFVA